MTRTTCKPWSLALALAAGLMMAACGAPSEEPGMEAGSAPAGAEARAAGGGAEDLPIPEKVWKAAAIARAIRAEPDAAAEILEREGVTREEFEDLLYEIAADPDLSAAYEAELER